MNKEEIINVIKLGGKQFKGGINMEILIYQDLNQYLKYLNLMFILLML